MSRTVLVTGATGFVGGAVVEALLRHGRQVVGFSPPPPTGTDLSCLPAAHRDMPEIAGDVRDGAQLRAVMRSHDVGTVIHLAAMTPDARGEATAAQATLDVNVCGTAAVVLAAAEAGVERLVLASSVAVYGSGHPDGARLDEDLPPRPQSLYALSKECAEQVVRRLGTGTGLDWRIGRLGRVFGPSEQPNDTRATMSQIFVATHAARLRRRVRFARPCVKAWHYASDAAEALVMLAEAPEAPSRTFNLGSPDLWSLSQWCGHLAEVFEGFDFTVGPDLRGDADDRMEIELNGASDGGNLSLERFEREIGPMPGRSLDTAFADYMAALEAPAGALAGAPAFGRQPA